MTDIEQKALALVNEVAADALIWVIDDVKGGVVWETLCLAIDQHEAFRREVSDAVEAYNDLWRKRTPGRDEFMGHFIRFILPKPVDPLVEAWLDAFPGNHREDSVEECEKIRAALAKRGLEVREIEG